MAAPRLDAPSPLWGILVGEALLFLAAVVLAAVGVTQSWSDCVASTVAYCSKETAERV